MDMDAAPISDNRPQGDVITPTLIGVSTTRLISRATFCASSRVFIDIEDEGIPNEEDELHIDAGRPRQPNKRRLWTRDHFTKISSDRENPQVG